MKDGRVLNLLAEGRLVNLAAGNGHPAEIMDLSFAAQALAAAWLAEKGQTLETRVYNVPESIDLEVARRKLAAMGLRIDALTDEQAQYLGRKEPVT